MWYTLEDKWVKTDEHGRIMARIKRIEGEFAASKVEVDPEGIGHSKSRGCYISLETAKAAVE